MHFGYLLVVAKILRTFLRFSDIRGKFRRYAVRDFTKANFHELENPSI